MVKKYGIFLAAAVMVVCFCVPAVFAEMNLNDSLKAQLKDIQAKKEQTTKEYETAVSQTNKEADGKIHQLKKEYKKAYGECVKARDAQCGKLHSDYEASMQPLRDQEKKIISSMVPNERMNFANPKYERQEKK